mmetsp:Transcript_39475/g.84197  ORF Transcript_39475/g.84197 Transcript_39475/m.84197 type:complete len:241 (+) Transcript_39475:328-1050(+)
MSLPPKLIQGLGLPIDSAKSHRRPNFPLAARENFGRLQLHQLHALRSGRPEKLRPVVPGAWLRGVVLQGGPALFFEVRKLHQPAWRSLRPRHRRPPPRFARQGHGLRDQGRHREVRQVLRGSRTPYKSRLQRKSAGWGEPFTVDYQEWRSMRHGIGLPVPEWCHQQAQLDCGHELLDESNCLPRKARSWGRTSKPEGEGQEPTRYHHHCQQGGCCLVWSCSNTAAAHAQRHRPCRSLEGA